MLVAAFNNFDELLAALPRHADIVATPNPDGTTSSHVAGAFDSVILQCSSGSIALSDPRLSGAIVAAIQSVT